MAAIYSVFTSPHHAPMPNHLPTLIVTPHGQPQQILYSYLHTEFNTVNYLLTPSPQGDLCVAKLFPPTHKRAAAPGGGGGGGALSDPGHGAAAAHKNPALRGTGGDRFENVVRCEASRDLRWTIENTGVRSPIYKVVNSDDTPLYQISKPNPNADFWTMFYFAYAGHQIPPRRVEFGRVSKNAPEKGGGTRITITGKTEDEKKVWQTLGEGNEDCVEWVVACACLNLLDDEILKAAERKMTGSGPASTANVSNGAGVASSSSAPAVSAPARGVASSGPPPSRGPASSLPPSSSGAGPSRPVASTLQPFRGAGGPPPPGKPRSNPSLAAQAPPRPGIPHGQSHLPPRSASVEPPRAAPMAGGGRPSAPGQQQYAQRMAPAPLQVDPRSHPQRPPPHQQQQQGPYRGGPQSPRSPYGPGGPSSAPPGQQLPAGFDPRRHQAPPPPHPHRVQQRPPQNGQRF